VFKIKPLFINNFESMTNLEPFETFGYSSATAKETRRNWIAKIDIFY